MVILGPGGTVKNLAKKELKKCENLIFLVKKTHRLREVVKWIFRNRRFPNGDGFTERHFPKYLDRVENRQNEGRRFLVVGGPVSENWSKWSKRVKKVSFGVSIGLKQGGACHSRYSVPVA